MPSQPPRPDHDLEFLRDFFENAPDMFVSVDAKTGTVRDCNAKVSETLGWPRDQVIGRPVQDFYDEASLDDVAAALRQFRDTGQATAQRLLVRRADGSRLPVSLRVSAVRDDDGTILYSRSVWRDLSLQDQVESLRLEARLRESQRLESLAVLAGGIAHDFNNILTGILGNAGLTLLSLAPDADERPLVEEIEKASLRAAGLTHQMLAYSGHSRFEIEPVCLSELAREMTRLLDAGLPKNIRVRLQLDEPGPRCEVDATQIRQVVMNLVTNGAQAIGTAQGTVQVQTGTLEADSEMLAGMLHGAELQTGEYAFVRVVDDGCGMTDEVVERMFDPFFTTKDTGHGLGLAAMLGIVRGHDGAVGVRSAPGAGTTVTVLLPTTEKALTIPAVPPVRSHHGGRVLVIDDEASVRTLARRVLERVGYEVTLAANGEEGLARYREHCHQLQAVLLDRTMPDMGGAEALRRLRAIDDRPRMILMSGYDSHGIDDPGDTAGPDAFLQKPFQAGDLLDLVARQLSGG